MDDTAYLSAIIGNPPGHPGFRQLGLDYLAFLTFREGNLYSNPLADPLFMQAWIEHLGRASYADGKTIYGGYLENRSDMWRGTYLDRQPHGCGFHLGVDVWLQEGAFIRCPVPVEVEDVYCDDDQDGGWGGRVTVRGPHGRVIFAHLSDIVVRRGDELEAGDVLGCVGPIRQNGGWAPHLHLQGLADSIDLYEVDGYGPLDSSTSKLYPHPGPLLTP